MKKIVRRSHIKENFRQNLKEQFTAGDVADVFVPGVSAYKNFKRGNVVGGLVDAGLDVASLAAGVFSGGLGYGAARAAISAAKAGKKALTVATKAGKKPQTVAAKSTRVPNTGSINGPWGRRVGKPTKAAKPTKKGKGSGAATGAAVGAGAGIAGALLGGGGSGSSQPLAKDRPQTGFRDRYQGIDPFRSGEIRTSAGYYDTPVGRRQLYKGAGGGLVAPPSTMYEHKVFSQLQEMVSKSIKTREINNILVTQDMAKNIVQLHEALNTNNKKLLEESVQSKDGFFEVLDFSVRN
jgi:hypothetical protein